MPMLKQVIAVLHITSADAAEVSNQLRRTGRARPSGIRAIWVWHAMASWCISPATQEMEWSTGWFASWLIMSMPCVATASVWLFRHWIVEAYPLRTALDGRGKTCAGAFKLSQSLPEALRRNVCAPRIVLGQRRACLFKELAKRTPVAPYQYEHVYFFLAVGTKGVGATN
jgi:hypothetical protein